MSYFRFFCCCAVVLTISIGCSPQETATNTTNANSVEESPQVAKIELHTLNEEELAQGWISLFDGQTLFGWEQQNKANWRVEDGAIVVDEGEVGLLTTTSQFSDYQLTLQFRAAKGTNSGVFLHTPKQPTDPATDCYELNIAPPDNRFPTLSLVRRIKAEGSFDSEDWQSYDITVSGGDVKVTLNGEHTMEYADPNPLQRGYIGLQLNEGKVEFRDIKLRPLGTEEIFSGKDLEGWKSHPESISEFSVTEEGWLNVQNGLGQLETEQSYGDFVLQLECISLAKHLNSGIFFRCIPGSKMDGYESQIHNGYQNDNRQDPMDYGSGGIFRRQKARIVVADDEEWFHKTIIADGPHMAVWINGMQVSDWTDDREPNENPRRGLRTEPGSIMIQGHDETTNLSFRNLRIVEIAKRELSAEP